MQLCALKFGFAIRFFTESPPRTFFSTPQADGLAAIRNLLRVSPETVAEEILEQAGAEALYELRRLVGAPGEPWSAAAARAAAAATDSLDATRLQVCVCLK